MQQRQRSGETQAMGALTRRCWTNQLYHMQAREASGGCGVAEVGPAGARPQGPPAHAQGARAGHPLGAAPASLLPSSAIPNVA